MWSLIPFMRPLITFPKALSPNTITLGVRFQHMNWGSGAKRFRLLLDPVYCLWVFQERWPFQACSSKATCSLSWRAFIILGLLPGALKFSLFLISQIFLKFCFSLHICFAFSSILCHGSSQFLQPFLLWHDLLMNYDRLITGLGSPRFPIHIPRRGNLIGLVHPFMPGHVLSHLSMGCLRFRCPTLV